MEQTVALFIYFTIVLKCTRTFWGHSYRFDALEVKKRLKKFSGPRRVVYYDKELQNAKVIYA